MQADIHHHRCFDCPIYQLLAEVMAYDCTYMQVSLLRTSPLQQQCWPRQQRLPHRLLSPLEGTGIFCRLLQLQATTLLLMCQRKSPLDLQAALARQNVTAASVTLLSAVPAAIAATHSCPLGTLVAGNCIGTAPYTPQHVHHNPASDIAIFMSEHLARQE